MLYFCRRIKTFLPARKKLVGGQEAVATRKNREKLRGLEDEQKVRIPFPLCVEVFLCCVEYKEQVRPA